MYFCFLFYSRNNALNFLEQLRNSNIESSIISTPSILKKGCSISIKTNDLNSAKNILSFKAYPSFYGVLRANENINAVEYIKIE